MKKSGIMLAAVMITSLATLSCAQKGKKSTVEYTNNIDSVSYAMGVNIAQNFKESGLEDINLDAMKEGFVDILQNDTSWLSNQDAITIIKAFMAKKQEEIAAKEKEEENAYFEENKKKEGIVTLESGIQYEIIKEGTGVKPTLQDTVLVHYTGSLKDGSVFDSSINRGPAKFGLNGNLIRGWKIAIPEMNEGATYKFYIPSQYGYGEYGNPQGGIPGNAPLIFEVELLDVLSK